MSNADTKTQQYILKVIDHIDAINLGKDFNKLDNRPKYKGQEMTGETDIPEVVAYAAGDNITISDGTISATDTTYTAGTNVNISSGNVISATDTTYTAGSGIAISSGNIISATSIINGGTTAPTTSTVGTVGTLYSYVDTTGTTPVPHILTCTAVSGSTYTWTDLLAGIESVLHTLNNGGN